MPSYKPTGTLTDEQKKAISPDKTRTTQFGQFAVSEEVQKDLNSGKEVAAFASHNIVEIPVPKVQVVEGYQPERLKDSKGVRYSNLKQGFSDQNERKNMRFKLNELTRAPLAVAQEEEARIQFEIEERLKLEIQAVREQVKKEAYTAGYEAGKKQAVQEVLAASKPSLQRFNAMIQSLEEMKHDVFKANEDLLVRVINWVGKMVVLKELKDDKDYTRRLILQLLERLGTRENIKIFVGMEAFHAAEQIKADLAQTLGQLKNISIELDPEIQDAGCRVETEFGEVDARIDVQLQNVTAALVNEAQ